MSPPLDNETIVPNLVLSTKKESVVHSLSASVSLGFEMLQILSPLFLLQSELDKHASQSLPGNPEKKR